MDDDLISSVLRQAAASGSRGLDRTCERVAEQLIEEGGVPSFDVHTADFDRDPFLICADRYWRLRFLALPTVLTAAECAAWLDGHVADDARADVALKWSLGYAFITRDTAESADELAESTGEIIEHYHGSNDVAAFATLYHAGKLRANASYDELYSFLGSSPLAMAAGPRQEEPVFTALRAFAAFGSRKLTIEHAIELLDQAWFSPGRSRQVVDLCVHAIWTAGRFDGKGELLRQRAAEAVELYPKDAILRFRLAKGEQLCGLHDAALVSIDEALRLLETVGSRSSHNYLQNQFNEERARFQDAEERARWAEEQQRRARSLEETIVELRQTVRSATVRAVEVVAVFAAVIAFTVGALQITLSGSMSLADRVWLMVAFGGSLLLFALLVIGCTWFITRGRGRRR